LPDTTHATFVHQNTVIKDFINAALAITQQHIVHARLHTPLNFFYHLFSIRKKIDRHWFDLPHDVSNVFPASMQCECHMFYASMTLLIFKELSSLHAICFSPEKHHLCMDLPPITTAREILHKYLALKINALLRCMKFHTNCFI
jgi:hypothetical protein